MPMAKSPNSAMYTGSTTRSGLMWFSFTAIAATTSASAMPWLINAERNTEIGTTSAGKTVLVMRLACSSRELEEHTSELQSHLNLVCRLLLEKKKQIVDAPDCRP